ncbi:MAG: SH3 domain-containing protein [Clostridia bacterium]|nr:SH3 domain-containing protein [Clostridia bacterium]
MNTPKKALLVFILTALFLSFFHVAALAETKTWEAHNSREPVYRATAFEEDLPQELRQVLDANGFESLPCYRGAMLEYGINEGGVLWHLRGTIALVALEEEGNRILVGLAENYEKDEEDESDESVEKEEREWTVSRLGAKALLPGREFYITLSDIGQAGSYGLGSEFFSVTYPRDDGGMESYGFDLAALWYVHAYESVDAEGNGIAILNRYSNYGFRVIDLPMASPLRDAPFYPAYVPLWIEHMNGIKDFPTSGEEAKRIAEASWERFDDIDLAMTSGLVNLRTRATVGSRSLGRVQSGALVQVLGQKSADRPWYHALRPRRGENTPWYHVRLGREEGWISGVYLRFPDGTGLRNISESMMWSAPLPMARTTEARILRISPNPQAESVMELPKGTLMHVMMECDNGWLYVMVPRQEIGWEMDVEGVSGYIQADEVEQGTILSHAKP